MEATQPAAFAKTYQAISTRVLSESRRTYSALVDDATLQRWVTETVTSLLTEHTSVTTFVPVLAMRDIRVLVERYQILSEASA